MTSRTTTRLNLEFLEVRDVPAATLGNVTGSVTLNNSLNVPGAAVTLSGTSSTGVAVNIAAVTDSGGIFTFQNVVPGSYNLQAAGTAAIINSNTSPVPVVVTPGQTIQKNLSLTGGIAPTVISMRQFLNVPNFASVNAPAGTGNALINPRSNEAPEATNVAFTDVSTPINSTPTTVNLADKFSDPDTVSHPGQETLTLTASSTNPTLVTTSITNNQLTLTYAAGKAGTAEIFIVAKDTFGNKVSRSFQVEVTGGTTDRPNVAPSLSKALDPINVAKNAVSKSINLAGKFTDADITNSEVQFNIVNGGVPSTVKMTLLDTTAPQTVANFLDYVDDGDYNNAIFTRLVSGFVLQGGGGKINSAGTEITPVDLNPAVPNEFGTPNNKYTVAMAQSGSNINSGTNQFFINLVDNAAGNVNDLDSKSFAVFGKVEDSASQAVVDQLATTTNRNVSSNKALADANPTLNLENLPLTNYAGSSFPSDATTDNYMRIDNVSVLRRDEKLTYSAISLNPDLVTVSTAQEWLTLNYIANRTGTAVIVVTAVDKFGLSFSRQFTVTVG